MPGHLPNAGSLDKAGDAGRRVVTSLPTEREFEEPRGADGHIVPDQQEAGFLRGLPA